MNTHVLKCWPEPFQATWDGRKTHEIRVNDRDYHAGDQLRLHEYDPDTSKFSMRYVITNVTHLTPGGKYGLPENMVVMSTRLIFKHAPSVERKNLNILLAGVGRQPMRIAHNPNGTTEIRFGTGDFRVDVSDSVDSDDVLVTCRNGKSVSSEILNSPTLIVEMVRNHLFLLDMTTRTSTEGFVGEVDGS
jgi:Domain of unknown function (DUF3850)